ncbi:MAG: heme lyase CcmF/NrfE family subunit [Terriglobales bacterium]
MQIVGSFAVLLAFVLAAYALLVGIAGLSLRHDRLVGSALRAATAVFPVLTVGVGCLVALILRNDFSLTYIAEHSNRALPFYYKIAVFWSGQEGSLLFWSWLLAGYGFVAILRSRTTAPQLRPLVGTNLMGVQVFFLTLNNFVATPFASLNQATPPDGNGLNPLLQYPQMVIHPPMLYMGYVGFSVPFAFALAALIKKYPGDRWIGVTRRWTMVAWGFLSIGIVLGGHWAYSVLGWGGYWAWDPVENASFLPWLMGTAFLHSVMMQEKRGMLKVWNIWLVFSTFLLAIFGTFLTRSGVVSSVHAFAQSSIGGWFIGFIVIAISVCLFTFMKNREFLRSEHTLESTASRESGFLFNNFVLLLAAFAILWGTLFPVLSEWVQGQKITVGREFFDRIDIPIFLFLIFLTGVGPLLAWRRTSFSSLRRNFLVPTGAAVLTAVGCLVGGIRSPYPIVSFSLVAFVVVCIAMEFGRGAKVIAQRQKIGRPRALAQLTLRNTRRYGGFVVHVGIMLMAVGITGSAFNRDVEGPIPYKAHLQLGPYTLISQANTQDDNENYSSEAAIIDVTRNGRHITTLYPSRRMYKASQQAASMVAIHSTPLEDIYLVYAGDDPMTRQPILHAFLNPLVFWVWAGAVVLVLGILIALLPNRTFPSRVAEEVGRNAVTQKAGA